MKRASGQTLVILEEALDLLADQVSGVSLISDIALAAKVISREVNRAGLSEILGEIGRENSHGEQVQKLDSFADEVIQ